MKKPRSSSKANLVSVSHVLQNTPKRTQDIFTISQLRKQWALIVGDLLAGQTRPKKSDRGILWISVENSALNYELSLMKPQILEKIKEVSGQSYKNLKFYLDEIPQTIKSSENPLGPKFIRVPAEENEELQSILNRVKSMSLYLQKNRK